MTHRRGSAHRLLTGLSVPATPTVLALALAGCAAGTGGMAAPAAPGSGPGSPVVTPGLESIIASATRDAAARLAVDPADIEVLRAERVTWSDGSLGCPAPDRMYTQALVPGYRVLLRISGQVLDYHAAANGPPVLCPPERALEPIVDERI